MDGENGIAQSLLPPLDPAAWPEAIGDLRGSFAGRLNVYKVMANHPRLLAAWVPLRNHLVASNALGAELTEIAILRIGYRLDCAYERAHHIVRARACGVSDIRIGQALTPEGPDDARDALVARAVDELLCDKALSAGTSAALVQRLGREAVLDVIGLVGFYSTLGYILNSFSTHIDEDIAEALSLCPFDQP